MLLLGGGEEKVSKKEKEEDRPFSEQTPPSTWVYFNTGKSVTSPQLHQESVRAPFLPCSLLLSPLCDVCPPLEGPGVPPERVDAVSSWSLFQEGYEAKKKKVFLSYNLRSGRGAPVCELLEKRCPYPNPWEEAGKSNPSPELFLLSWKLHCHSPTAKKNKNMEYVYHLNNPKLYYHGKQKHCCTRQGEKEKSQRVNHWH